MCRLPLCHCRLLCASQAEPTALWNWKSNSFSSTVDLYLHRSKGASNKSNLFHCFFLMKSATLSTKGRRALFSLLVPSPYKAPQVAASLGQSRWLSPTSLGPNTASAKPSTGNAGSHRMTLRAQCRESVQSTPYSPLPTWGVPCFTCKKLHWTQGQRLEGPLWSHPNSTTQINLNPIDFCFYLSMVWKIPIHFWAKKIPMHLSKC